MVYYLARMAFAVERPATRLAPPRLVRVQRTCKICRGSAEATYEIKGRTYYYCAPCDFLQNFHLEDHVGAEAAQREENDDARARLWPAGDSEAMRAKGWEMLGLMSSPVAWASRNVHERLKTIPAYDRWYKGRARKKFPRVLDFGCGHGVIVRELRKEGFEATGLDPFSSARDPFIYRASLLETRFPEGAYDGIFSVETMEHIPNVLETYRELCRILRPGGVLLAQTRRLEDPDYRSQRENWFYLQEPATHVSIYSETTMRRIAAKVGFRSVRFRGVKFARFEK